MQNPSALNRRNCRKVRSALALAGLVWVTAALAAPSAQAQTLTVLYSFKGGATDGENPQAGVIMDKAGNLCGTTVEAHAPLEGIAFELTTTGTETVLHRFAGGTDGANPYAGLIEGAAGTFYGTTSAGGASNSGVVFKVTKTGETVLYTFTGPPGDGAIPYAGLVQDAAGNLYGTTSAGGKFNSGVVFKLDTAGNETVLYNFTGGADGAFPYGGLLLSSAGNLFGTTSAGGITAGNCFPGGCGVVFVLDTTTGAQKVLYSFTGSPDGAYPYAGLAGDPAGNLYGTTYNGGSGPCTNGCGVVFKLDLAGTETVLHSLTGYPTDGAFPYAGVVFDTAGNIYGTATYGGESDNGVVFKLNASGKETMVYSFLGGMAGALPHGGLILDSSGNLYGTTYSAGITSAACGGKDSGCGIVFKLTQ